jgi:hypothetical protein
MYLPGNSYTPIYCNKTDIGLKLRGRLNVAPTPYQAAPYQNGVPSQLVDDALLNVVIQEKENWLNYILEQMYYLPLVNEHPILKDIIESLVIAELLRIHYQGQGIAQLSGDLSGTGTDLKQYAYGLVQMLTIGRGIFIPGQPPAQPGISGGIQQPQPLFLVGESQKDSIEEDSITREFTYSGKRVFHRRYLRDVDFIHGDVLNG